MRGLAKYWLVLDAKRSAHIKAAAIVQKSAALQASRQHLQDRAAELSDIMATVLAKYDEAVAHQQLLTDDDNNGEGEMEEDKPLPEFSTERFDPDGERFDPSIDLTSLFRVRHSEHTQRKGAHKKVRTVAALLYLKSCGECASETFGSQHMSASPVYLKAGSSVEYVQTLLRMFLKEYRDKGDPTKELLLRLDSLDPRWRNLKQLPRRFYVESSRLASEVRSLIRNDGMVLAQSPVFGVPTQRNFFFIFRKCDENAVVGRLMRS